MVCVVQILDNIFFEWYSFWTWHFWVVHFTDKIFFKCYCCCRRYLWRVYSLGKLFFWVVQVLDKTFLSSTLIILYIFRVIQFLDKILSVIIFKQNIIWVVQFLGMTFLSSTLFKQDFFFWVVHILDIRFWAVHFLEKVLFEWYSFGAWHFWVVQF